MSKYVQVREQVTHCFEKKDKGHNYQQFFLHIQDSIEI